MVTAPLIRHTYQGETGREVVWFEDPEAHTLPEMFWTRVQKWSNDTAMRTKDFGIWQEITWGDFGKAARAVGMALDKQGLGKGDVACVLSNTVPEWMFADMGIQGMGGICAGIYPTDAAAQVEYLVNDSKARTIFVEDEEQLDKALEIRGNCPTLEKIVIFDMEGLADFQDDMAISFDDFMGEDPANARFFAGGAGDRMQFDLPGYGLHKLREAGVNAEWTRHCTYSDPDRFYSYRRATHQGEADYGRLIAVIRL